ncbi:MAG: amino acid adenylation domain-containing protein [Nocardioidaceae bacterium]
MSARVLGGVEVASDLVDAVAESARRCPYRPATVHNQVAMTYRELDMRIRATARALGPSPGVVGVLTSRSPDTIVALLGVLTAGGTYCPIDPGYPAERLHTMIAAAGIRTVLATGPMPAMPPDLALLRLPADVALLRLPGDGPDPAPFAVIDTDAPAYLLFTSGSTGEPKPVITSRPAIAIATSALGVLFGITPQDRVLQFASLSWDTCLEEILPTLTCAATLVFDDEAYTGSFPRFLRMLEREQITVLDLPTAFWHEFVRYLAESMATLSSSVRLMIIGGEAVDQARLDDWRALPTSHVRLLNTYGCTETTLITHAADLADGDGIPIGLALPHVREHLSSEGELLVGGAAIATGYLGRVGETLTRFVDLPDGRYFRTGDKVRRGDDGELFHLGRLDHEVKIRGVRVDPAEVEAHLTQHPAVSAAAVTSVRRAGRTTMLGYVVADGDSDFRAWLRERVPEHLVPSRITVVPELVRTASGKTNRAATHRRYPPTED